MSEPDDWDMRDIQNFLVTQKMRMGGGMALLGSDAKFYGSMLDRKSYAPDLKTLYPRLKEDPFSMLVARNALASLILCGFSRWIKPSRRNGAVGYQDSTIFKITYWLTSIFASLLLASSIIILYFVRPMPARLAIIAVFNLLLSVCLSGLTNAKRSEIFAVTTA